MAVFVGDARLLGIDIHSERIEVTDYLAADPSKLADATHVAELADGFWERVVAWTDQHDIRIMDSLTAILSLTTIPR